MSTLYPNFWRRYTRSKLRFIREEMQVRKKTPHSSTLNLNFRRYIRNKLRFSKDEAELRK